MPRVLNLNELEAPVQELVQRVAVGDDPVIFQDGERPLAVLASHESVLAMAAMVNLPRWEEWISQMRQNFPQLAERLFKVTRAAVPAQLDKSELGFDPGTGSVGSPDGRELMAAELRQMGVPVTDDSLLDAIYAALMELCEAKEKIFREDLKVMAQEMIAEAPQRLRLLALTVQSTSGLPAMAEVTLELGHGPAMRREHGDGPIDASYKAIEKLTGLRAEVENFSVIAATKGRDAMSEAMIELSLDGTTVVGRGASTNAVEAAVHAYLNALNFLLELRRETEAGATAG